jgi:alkylation response protein AidB-like acyl-CoA dehydrogenase
MDFEITYTEEQERFRAEVRAWLDANAPTEDLPSDEAEMSEEQRRAVREFRRKLGAKGWLAPTWPKEYGGGGLSSAHAVVLNEELARRKVPMAYDLGLSLGAPAIMVHGTQEQKDRFLPPILKGEVITWQVFSEPEAGSDLASLKTRAERDGDEYIINGSKQFVGHIGSRPDYLYTLVNTDPEGPRHENISAFLVPAHLPGISIVPMDLIAGEKQFVYFDNVRVPREYLIGAENKGWMVANTTLELEHGGRGSPGGEGTGRTTRLAEVIEYLRTHL